MRKSKTKPVAEPPKPPRQPPSRVPAALSVFEGAGIEVKRGDDDSHPWIVAGRFYYWVTAGHWRSIDGARQGATASGLVRTIRDDAGDVARAEQRHAVEAACERAVETALTATELLQDHQHERVQP